MARDIGTITSAANWASSAAARCHTLAAYFCQGNRTAQQALDPGSILGGHEREGQVEDAEER